MKIRKIDLTNYRKFRSASLELGEGVVGVLGQNGSGKSTLVEAIAWAIYGNESSILRDGKDGVRWSLASPNDECRVSIDFDLEADHYRLSRWLKGKSQKVEASLEVNEMRVASGDEGVTTEMIKRLGMDHKAFFVSVFARQKDLAALSSLRPAERKKLILSMLGIDQLDRVVDEISADARAMKQEMDLISSALRTPDGQDRAAVARDELAKASEIITRLTEEETSIVAKLTEMEKYVQRAKGEMEKAEGRSKQHQQLRSAIAGLESDQRNGAARTEQIKKDLKALEEKALELPKLEAQESESRRLDSERERLDEDRVKFSQLQSMQQMLAQRGSELQNWQTELVNAEAELAGLGDFETIISKAETAIERYDEAVQNAKQEGAWKVKEQARLEGELVEKKARRDEVHRLGPDSVCPTCERKMESQHGVLLRKIDVEIAQVQTSLDDLRTLRTQGDEFIARNLKLKATQDQRKKEGLALREKAAGLQQRRRSALAGIEKAKDDQEKATRQIALLGEVRYDTAKHEQVRRRLQELKPSVDRLIRLRTELQRRPVLDKELLATEDRMRSTAENLGSTKNQLNELNFDPEELRISRERYTKERDFKEAAQTTLSKTREEAVLQQSIRSTASRRLQELEENEAKAASLRTKHTELNVLLQVMKDFRANVTSRVLPTLAHNASELFVELTDGKYAGLEIDENYEMQVLDKGETYQLGRFSGGESDLANLCLRLAISRLIAERSGQHVNFLVLDEIFGSQDAVRKRNILGLLASLQKQFGQILLITHIDDVKDAVDDLVVVREQQDGSSVLRGDVDG